MAIDSLLDPTSGNLHPRDSANLRSACVTGQASASLKLCIRRCKASTLCSSVACQIVINGSSGTTCSISGPSATHSSPDLRDCCSSASCGTPSSCHSASTQPSGSSTISASAYAAAKSFAKSIRSPSESDVASLIRVCLGCSCSSHYYLFQ